MEELGHLGREEVGQDGREAHGQFFGHRRLGPDGVQGELGGEVPIGCDDLLPVDALVLGVGRFEVFAQDLVGLRGILALAV